MIELKLFSATFLLVFMRVTQTKNVTNDHYLLAGITPIFIATGEVATVLWVVNNGWSSIPWIGLGGGVGAVLSMYVHKRWVR